MIGKLLIRDGRTEREITVAGTVTVGRDVTCDLSAGDPMLSRHHAEFVARGQAVHVRDVKSRNGVIVNGVRVSEAVLHPGDEIKIANFRMTYLGDAPAPASAAGPSTVGADAVLEDVSDKTRVVPRGHARQGRQSIVGHASGHEADGTRIVPKRGTRPAGAGVNGPTPVRSSGLAQPQNTPAASEIPTHRAHAATTSWRSRVVVQSLSLALAVFVATAVPLGWWQSRIVQGVALSRARALVSWLAAEASVGLGRRDVARVADDVEREAGVVTAIVVAPDGQVLAPLSRATGVFRVIPGVGVPAENVLRVRWAWSQGLLHIVRPVADGANPHAAVAWVVFRPSEPPDIGNRAVVIIPALFFAVVAAIVVAGMITSRTLRALTLLNQDVELATNGQLEAVADPLGARPVRDLTDTLNYLVARVRLAGGGVPGTPAMPSPRRTADVAGASGAVPSRPATSVQTSRHSGSSVSSQAVATTAADPSGRMDIVADANFRVVDVGAGVVDLFALQREQVLGQHLVDALPDPLVVDALLKCLADLPGAGERTDTVAWKGLPGGLRVRVVTAGQNQPVVVEFRVNQDSLRG